VVEDWDLLPEYFAPQPELGLGAQINLPRPGRGGWDYHAEHGLFLHELGHSFDHANVTPLLRKRFKVLAGTKCSWRAAHCRFRDRWDSTSVLDSPPGEWFAEMYASCALGITQAEYQLEGYNTYGWLPPEGSDSAICSLLSLRETSSGKTAALEGAPVVRDGRCRDRTSDLLLVRPCRRVCVDPREPTETARFHGFWADFDHHPASLPLNRCRAFGA